MIELKKEELPKILRELFKYYAGIIGCDSIKQNAQGDLVYRFDYTESTAINNFAEFLKKEYPGYLNISKLFDFLGFGFCKWSYVKEQKEQETKRNYNIKAHWIFGAKNFSEFLKRTKSQKYFYYTKFVPKYNISEDEIIKFLKDKGLIIEKEDIVIEDEIIIKIYPLNPTEENYKKLRHNTLDGLQLCLDNTTLYKYKSPFCINCIYKFACKKILKKNFPKLYQKRLAEQIRLNRKNRE